MVNRSALSLLAAFSLILACSSDDSPTDVDTEDPLADLPDDVDTGDGPDSSVEDANVEDEGTTDHDALADRGQDPPDAAGEDQAVIVCEPTAVGTFPAGAIELSHDNGTGVATLRTGFSRWSYEGIEGTVDLLAEPNWEAVRFDLEAPATVYGARVQWDHLPDHETAAVLGAYPDFGSNGFDFWRWDPYAVGTRCLSSDDNGTWTDYVFAEPIEVALPGLLYIAHFEATDADPLFLFDGDTLGEGECATYAECHSAVNFPEVDDSFYYHGLSTMIPYDYLVRLVVEYHDEIPPEDTWFQAVPDFMASSRVAFGDYDNDGDDDIMTNGPTLYRNLGDGTFEDASAEAGLDAVANPTGGGIWGDYDNDECLDYFGFGSGYDTGEALLHSRCDGTFEDLTAASGINDLQTDVDCSTQEVEHSATEGAAWVDLDADGFLDLYLAEHICWEKEEFYRDRIWRNQGDGTFGEWTTEHGFLDLRFAGRGTSPIDADRDGDMDVLVSNYRLNRNLFYDNQGSGQFTETAYEVGLAGTLHWFSMRSYFGHTIGSAWLDLENDGDWDVIEANLAHPRFYHFSDRTQLLVNDGIGHFTDIHEEAGIFYRETHSNPTVLDFDLDGFSDIFITAVYDGRFSELYRNNGDLTFTQVNYPSGAVIHNGWGSATADVDNDGDPDLLAYRLFLNETGASSQHWIQVRALGGVTANRAGIGAQVEVDAGETTLMGHVSGGSGTGCQDSQVLVFGLGAATAVDEIRVRYPGGAQVTLSGPIAADQRIWIQETGDSHYGWTP